MSLDQQNEFVEFGGLVTDGRGNNFAVFADQEITRNVVGGVKSVNFLFGVESHRERITHLFPESGDRFAGFAARYGQENEVFVPLEAVDDVLLRGSIPRGRDRTRSPRNSEAPLCRADCPG